VKPPEQHGPAEPGPSGTSRPGDAWAEDELDELLTEPAGAGRLAQVITAAAAPDEAESFACEDTAVVAFREAFPVLPSGTTRGLSRISGRAATVVLVGGLVLSGGAAAAAVGALPGATQQAAKDVLAKVGLTVPGPKQHTVEHPRKHAPSAQPPAPTIEPPASPRDSERSNGRGGASDLASPTTSAGAGKGAAVSGSASDGNSHAGEHGSPTGAPPGKAKTKAPKPQPTKRHAGASHPPHPGASHTPEPGAGAGSSQADGGRR
jgi:hypothetical protein